MKSAVIAIVGRPSAGKSTLMNRLCGQKISIVSSAPQTTRNTIRGILTDPRGQLIFIDTPGFHLSEKKINQRMKSLVAESLNEVDAALYLIDSSRAPGEEETAVAQILAERSTATVVALNKVDLDSERDGPPALQHEAFVSHYLPAAPVAKISALTGAGVRELVKLLFEAAPEGELLYPEEFYTDQPPEFRVSEIIREKAIERVHQEVPHALYVEIADMEQKEEQPSSASASASASASDSSEPRLWVRAFLVTERESQKAIVIGRGGSMIREIRVAAQKEIEAVFPYRVYLDLRVKVNPKWRKSDPTLKRLIY